MGIQGEKWIVTKKFDGIPKPTDFELVKEDLGELAEGEIAYESEYISVDPYQRAYAVRFTPPFTMIGSAVAKVIESKDKDFPVGSRIVISHGWVKRGKVNPKQGRQTPGSTPPVQKAPEMHGVSPSYLLGACGMPGNTAYFGFLELCKPKKGETVVVNGAAGAVGSLVGQIAKIKGCTVIGYAGTDDKVQWLKDLGFDFAFNYKKISAAESLTQAAPNGVDCFFDNVGGSESSVILSRMNTFGRIAVCGAISTYNDKQVATAPVIQGSLVTKQLKMEGFLVQRWGSRWNEGIIAMAQWIKEGKIKVKETVVQGFENTPSALVGLLQGENTGKMVVKC